MTLWAGDQLVRKLCRCERRAHGSGRMDFAARVLLAVWCVGLRLLGLLEQAGLARSRMPGAIKVVGGAGIIRGATSDKPHTRSS